MYLSEWHIFDLLTALIVNTGNVDSIKKNMSSLESADAGLMGQLWCESCQSYLKREPIRMCEQGHNMCNRCRNHMSSRLFCTAQSSNLRNVHMEDIVAALIYPCPFETLVASNCGFSLMPFDIAQHVRESHSSECWEGNVDSEWIQLPVSFVQYQKAIFKFGQLFFLLLSRNTDWLSFIVFMSAMRRILVAISMILKLKTVYHLFRHVVLSPLSSRWE